MTKKKNPGKKMIAELSAKSVGEPCGKCVLFNSSKSQLKRVIVGTTRSDNLRRGSY